MNKIEKYLSALPKKQIYMLYAMTLFAFGAILYQIVPGMIDKQTSLQNNISEVKRNIRHISIRRLARDYKKDKVLYLKKQSELEKEKDKIRVVLSKLKSLRFLSFDEKRWIDTLDDTLNSSLKYHLKLKSISNDANVSITKDTLLQVKKNVTIKGDGSYQNTIRYLHYIENLPVLIRFKFVNIKIDDKKIGFEINFDTFGVKL